MSEPAATLKDGAIFWRDTFKPRDEAVRLAEQFESVKGHDWFSPLARQRAANLRAVIAEFDQIHQQEIAA